MNKRVLFIAGATVLIALLVGGGIMLFGGKGREAAAGAGQAGTEQIGRAHV